MAMSIFCKFSILLVTALGNYGMILRGSSVNGRFREYFVFFCFLLHLRSSSVINLSVVI